MFLIDERTGIFREKFNQQQQKEQNGHSKTEKMTSNIK